MRSAALLVGGMLLVGFAAGLGLGPDAPLRAMVAAAVLVLPGAILVAAALPNRPMGAATRLLLSIGSSLGLLVALGFALHATGIGLHPWAWAVAIATTTVLAAVIAVWRRAAVVLPAPERGPEAMSVVLLTLAGLIAVGAVILSARTHQATIAAPLTQLWLVPDASGAELGLRNLEGRPTAYRVVLLLDGEELQEWTVERVPPGATWGVPLGPDVLDFSERAEVRLYLAGEAEPYRSVFLDGPS
jgi:hypothetical protein